MINSTEKHGEVIENEDQKREDFILQERKKKKMEAGSLLLKDQYGHYKRPIFTGQDPSHITNVHSYLSQV